MKLNIFFSNNEERLNFIKAQFKLVEVTLKDQKIDSPKLEGISYLKYKGSFKGIPGFWLEIQFSKESYSKDLYSKLVDLIDVDRIDDNVFYPTEPLKYKELEAGWFRKYGFSEDDYNEDSWGLFYKEVRTHLRDKRIEAAYSGLLIFLRYNPFYLKKYKRFNIFEELAYQLEENGNLGKAIKCLKLHLRLQPDSVEPYLNMTSFYIMNEMEDKAINLCKEALKKHPANKFLVSNLVLALSNIGNYEYAIEYIKKSIKLQPDNPFFLKMMGDILYEMEKNKEAIDCYQKAIKKLKKISIDDFTTDLYHGIASAYYEVDHFEEAVKYYKKVLKYYPGDGYVLLSLSQIYLNNLKDLKAALHYGKILVEMSPENGYGQYQLGLIYLQTENYEKARWHLYKARRILPSYEPIYEAIQLLKQNSKVIRLHSIF